ncbi:hypothetical protein [Chelatococcus asaccharovorans]|uniref:hypothetical protein n=1 Tax=Chelatococcus asaccharovorans TaxID=28210 RepID=UPI00224C66E3|nr:hypothetical protein [Chelatococcus asaccharovorans]CAH1661285.1 hypothetical protein CHELA17_50071 [Chelatococcus asaccharovorans]CAH1689891.1 hypothetical protein CHELA40_40123 [Chelatococcus asaccharovorans]
MSAVDPIIAHFIERRGHYAGLVRHGFPIVDGVYWNEPSPMIGGLLLLHLQQAKVRTGTASIDLRPTARPVRPLSAVVAELNSEHRPGFWYRGQRTRRECVYEGRVPRMEGAAPGINPIRVTLDALIPSAYRTYTHSKPADWQKFRLAPPLDNFSGPARAILASQNLELGELLLSAIELMLYDAIRIGQAHSARLGFAANLLAPGTTAAQPMLDLISIAQHYDYGSIMVDVSTSVGAAVWFATRDWTTGEIAGSSGGSPGVIYRFDATKIAEILRKHVDGPGAMPPPAMQALGVFGLADIATRFSFLDRPRAQQGGSLLGMENVATHFLMRINDAVEVFPFDHTSVTGRETSFAQADICPPNDHGVELFRPHDKYSIEPLSNTEFSALLSWMDMKPDRVTHLVEMRDAGVL